MHQEPIYYLFRRMRNSMILSSMTNCGEIAGSLYRGTIISKCQIFDVFYWRCRRQYITWTQPKFVRLNELHLFCTRLKTMCAAKFRVQTLMSMQVLGSDFRRFKVSTANNSHFASTHEHTHKGTSFDVVCAMYELRFLIENNEKVTLVFLHCTTSSGALRICTFSQMFDRFSSRTLCCSSWHVFCKQVLIVWDPVMLLIRSVVHSTHVQEEKCAILGPCCNAHTEGGLRITGRIEVNMTELSDVIKPCENSLVHILNICRKRNLFVISHVLENDY